MTTEQKIEHNADCKPEHMGEPDDEGMRDCSNCGLWEKEPKLYTHEWVNERAQRATAALKDGDIDIVFEVLESLSDFPKQRRDAVVVVVRHPDYADEISLHDFAEGNEAQVIYVDLGSNFYGVPEDAGQMAEFREGLEAEIADLPGNHPAVTQIKELLAGLEERVTS